MGNDKTKAELTLTAALRRLVAEVLDVVEERRGCHTAKSDTPLEPTRLKPPMGDTSVVRAETEITVGVDV